MCSSFVPFFLPSFTFDVHGAKHCQPRWEDQLQRLSSANATMARILSLGSTWLDFGHGTHSQTAEAISGPALWTTAAKDTTCSTKCLYIYIYITSWLVQNWGWKPQKMTSNQKTKTVEECFFALQAVSFLLHFGLCIYHAVTQTSWCIAHQLTQN